MRRKARSSGWHNRRVGNQVTCSIPSEVLPTCSLLPPDGFDQFAPFSCSTPTALAGPATRTPRAIASLDLDRKRVLYAIQILCVGQLPGTTCRAITTSWD